MKTTTIVLLLFFGMMCQAQPIIYVVNALEGTVEAFDPASNLFTVILDNLDAPQHVVFNGGNQTIYVSDPGQQKIIGVSSDGVFDLVNNTQAIDLELYDNNTKLVWTSVDDMVLQYDFSNESIDTLFESSFVLLQGLAVANDNLLFFADRNNEVIYKLDLQNNNNTEVILENIESAWDIEVEPSAEKIYFTNRSEEMIQRADFDGSNLDTIVADVGKLTGMAIDVEENKLYWATNKFGANPYKLQKSDFDGQNLETLIELSPFDDYMFFGLDLGDAIISSTVDWEQELSVAVYPNPFSHYVIIDNPFEEKITENTQLLLFDMSGKVYKSETVQNFPYLLKTSDLPNNNYCLEIRTNGLLHQSVLISKAH